MATAGFDPQGCLRLMEVLSSMGQMASDSHPASTDRITRLQEVIRSNPPEALAAQGRNQLNQSRNPLTYDISRDRDSLRINSRHGNRNVDQLLPR